VGKRGKGRLTVDNTFENSARLYDLDERDNVTADIPFYLAYAERYAGGVLELGCGTGRVGIPLAEAGFRVTGLDLSEQMLGVFREKLAARPELAEYITLTQGNMADFRFDRKFGLIIAPFRAFQALTDDRDIHSALFCVRNHLADNGVLIVNVFHPRPMMDESWVYPETVQWTRKDEKTGITVVKKHWGEKIDTANRIVYPRFAYEVTYPNGETSRAEDRLSLKYYYPEQLQAAVEAAGLSVVERYSWYDKTPIGGREIIFVCESF
jgi:SAM-dependent methyltransferase